MKNYKLPINLGVIVLLWFCLAFACKNGKDTGGSRNNNSGTTQSQTGNGKVPTEQDVRDAMTRHANDYWGTSYRNIVVTFESPVRVVAEGRLGETNNMYYEATVDWTLKYDDGIQIYITYYKGGTVRVSQDNYSNGEWKYDGGMKGEKTTSEVTKIN